ncbi:Indoleamine 2,3-dioxygenase [Tilletiaria anomala UBC 951]|uniref:Indoleamine 2,3-dioxygenase n=1 Tax=Tilletiaria anomala (strain ATCC 24038 / CBS 436.72 / UBC 951) TaxID=1037660 RepID=A0A066WEB1_TILAU|nr:Indoleamine 2,3-dioxygenase [Tilletiaria anomala UBC 951]KDN52116.1 Indoleamine 2,3-dioxygenase [Tilletiaria anomala UBC 951]
MPSQVSYPRWPKRDEAAEYYEFPPEHFLAQQVNPAKHRLSLPLSATAESSQSNNTDSVATTSGPSFDQASLAAVFEPWKYPQEGLNSENGMPDTSTLAAADFDIDVRTGFLPPEPPLSRLDSPYHIWEDLLSLARSSHLRLLGGGASSSPEGAPLARRWRRRVRQMPIISIEHDMHCDIRKARRGHLVLSFLAHFYLHSQPQSSHQPEPATSSWSDFRWFKTSAPDNELEEEGRGAHLDDIPAPISIPLVQLSEVLGLPPILTYATTVLWNWELSDPARGLTPDNVKIVETFTDTESERHFYLTSLLIEMRGVEALTLMRQSLDEAFVGDRLASKRLTDYLERLAGVISDLTRILAKVRDHCVPAEFYWAIRPWFRGSDASLAGRGWHYSGIDPEHVRRNLGGPSAGQSSLIHALDVFLDVDHSRRKERLRDRTPRSVDLGPSDATFMERMSFYMPRHHRDFLHHLRSLSFEDVSQSEPPTTTSHQSGTPHPVRAFIIDRIGTEPTLSFAYDKALKALKSLRDEHMKVAALYIISQSRKSPTAVHASDDLQVPITVAPTGRETTLVGTGGTDLVQFLKDCRINTVDAMIQPTH